MTQKIRRIFLLLFFTIIFTSLFSCAETQISIKNNDGTIYSPQRLLLEGQTEVNEAQYEQALQYYQAVIDNFPDDKENLAWAYYEIGYVYYLMEDYLNAKINFKIVIKDYKKQKDAYYLAQFMLSKIEEIEAASGITDETENTTDTNSTSE